MHFVRMYPYAAASALAGLLLVVGAIIVERKTSTEPGNLAVWGISGAPLVNPSSYSPHAIQENMTVPSGTNVSPTFIPPSKNLQGATAATDDMADIHELLSLISRPSGTKAPSSSGQSIAFAFVPTGLIASSIPVKERSEEQQSLYNYGNDAASYIQTYEDGNRGAPTILRDQAEDRQDAQKARAVKDVAKAIRNVGESLLGMEDVPESIRGAHTLLAKAYIQAAESLSRIPDAQADDAFIAAIEEYNSAADKLAQYYVEITAMLSLNGVIFSTEEPGSIFMFSGGASI